MTTAKHQRFLKRLDRSYEAEVFMARYMASRWNLVVVRMASTRAKRHEDWKDHSDSGDLYVMRTATCAPDRTETQVFVPDVGSCQIYTMDRVEVKWLTYDFTGRDDWPHGKYYMVCARHSWDRADPKPRAYFNLNPQKTHVGIVKHDSRPHWTIERRYDAGLEHEQEIYFCPLDLVHFMAL